MFVDYRGSVFGLLAWQWKSVLLFLAASSAIVAVEHFFGEHLRHAFLPTAPVMVVGGAIGIFVSFRTNSAYDRWWEGRKLWGALVNSSRHFASQVLTYLPEPNLQRSLVRRHLAYVHALRVTLRGDPLADDADFRSFVTAEELARLAGESSPTHALLHEQMRVLVAENEAGRLAPDRLRSFDETLRALLDVQGGCERIKKTPFPRGYGFIADRLIMVYGVLLPLGIVGTVDNDWITIPLTLLVCLSFLLISEVGRVLEDPFTHFWPALPLTAISKTIEVNLRQRLGETDLPAIPKPNERGILM
jgi:putative membrane protein